jgi:hypothetical protein
LIAKWNKTFEVFAFCHSRESEDTVYRGLTVAPRYDSAAGARFSRPWLSQQSTAIVFDFPARRVYKNKIWKPQEKTGFICEIYEVGKNGRS